MPGGLTRGHLANLPVDVIPSEIVDAVGRLIGDNYDAEFDTVMALPRCIRVVYTTWILSDEIDNGGFNQYFWNQDGRFLNEAAEGFATLGAAELADLAREALETVVREAGVQFAARNRVDDVGSLQAFHDLIKTSGLGMLDTKFRALLEAVDLPGLQGGYVLAHLDELPG